MSPVLRVSTYIYGVTKEIDGKTFILRANLGMWSLKSIISENWALFCGFQHTFMGFQGDRWKNIHSESKPRHVIPQINCLVKTSPVLRVSIHINGVSKQIEGKTFILRVNLGMWPLKFIVSENSGPVLWVSTHIYGVTKEIDGKTFILRVNLRHVTPQTDRLRKFSPVLRVSTHHYDGVSKEIDRKTFILRVNLDMRPLKLIVLEKWALS